MNKGRYIILAVLGLSVAGNIVQSYRYDELTAQRDYIYDGAVAHLRATLQRELIALSAADEYTLAMRTAQEAGAADASSPHRP